MRSAATSSRTFSPFLAYSKIQISATVYLPFGDPPYFLYSRQVRGGSYSSRYLLSGTVLSSGVAWLTFRKWYDARIWHESRNVISTTGRARRNITLRKH